MMTFEEWWEGWLKWDKARRDAKLPKDNKFDLARSCWNAAIRVGQEEFKNRATQKLFDPSLSKAKNRAWEIVNALPLEGDDDV